MMYIVAFILPPLALLMIGRVFQAIMNLIVFLLSILIFVGTLTFGSPISFPIWVLSVAWAMIVVYRDRADARMRRIALETIRSGGP